MVKNLRKITYATMIFIVVFLLCLIPVTYAENVINSTQFYFQKIDGTDDQIEFIGLSNPESGRLVIPEYKEENEGGSLKKYYVTNLRNGIVGSLNNITSLDLSACTRLTKITRSTFSNSTSLSGEIVFPESFVNLGHSNFENTQITKMTFLGDLVDTLNFDGNIPSTLEKVLITETSFISLTAESSLLTYCDQSIINYFGYVKVNNVETSLIKENGEYLTTNDYDTMAQGIENLKGFDVGGTLYTRDNITSLQYSGQNFIPQIEEEKQYVTASYSSGDGYTLSGETSVEENTTLVATLVIDEDYNESEFSVIVTDGEDNVDFTITQSGDTYTITIENVCSDINISIENVTQNVINNIYSITYPSEMKGYVISGNNEIKHGETFVFSFELNKFYNQSNYEIVITDTNNVELAKYNRTRQAYALENVTCDLVIKVNNVVLNEFSVGLSVTDAIGQELSNIGDGGTIKITSVLQDSMPLDSMTFAYYLDGTKLANTTSEFLYENITKGSHTISVVVTIAEIDQTYTTETTFEISKRIYSVNVTISNFTFNNTPFTPTFTKSAQNICGNYDFKVEMFVLEGNVWKETNEIKNVGKYKVNILFDEEIVELTQGSVTTCTFNVLPKEISVYYENKTYSFVYDNTRHYPQILVDGDTSVWEGLGLDLTEIREKLYTVSSSKVLIYDLPLNATSDDYDRYGEYLVNAGNYYSELVCENGNFVLKTSPSLLTSVNYSIAPKKVELDIQSGDVYKSSKQNPSKSYEIKLNDANEIVNITAYFTRESGNDVGKYAITGIQTISVETTGILSSNFNFVLSNKSENYYVISQKEVYVNWDDKTTFAFDGEYHAPACWVDDDFDGELILTVSGKQKLPCEKLQKYTATASCTSKNFKLVNNTVNFVINAKTLTANGDINCSVESSSGFSADYSLVLEEKPYSSNILSTPNNAFENYNVSGGYTISVVDDLGDNVNYNENVNINIEKPEYFEKGMKVLQVMPSGALKEISYTTSGNFLILNNVRLGSSFVFISPKSNFDLWLVLAICFVVLTIVFCGFWFVYKKKHKKS